mmetsp:Transcript_10155/g.11592  ORF Transcript_10155/g.11592 Transcript_10155/m.11592 type:complete len:145 (+) Transcript_10155:1-435(+)
MDFRMVPRQVLPHSNVATVTTDNGERATGRDVVDLGTPCLSGEGAVVLFLVPETGMHVVAPKVFFRLETRLFIGGEFLRGGEEKTEAISRGDDGLVDRVRGRPLVLHERRTCSSRHNADSSSSIGSSIAETLFDSLTMAAGMGH